MGLMVLSVIGVGSMLANVNKSLETTQKKERDYGESDYGG